MKNSRQGTSWSPLYMSTTCWSLEESWLQSWGSRRNFLPYIQNDQLRRGELLPRHEAGVQPWGRNSSTFVRSTSNEDPARNCNSCQTMTQQANYLTMLFSKSLLKTSIRSNRNPEFSTSLLWKWYAVKRTWWSTQRPTSKIRSDAWIGRKTEVRSYQIPDFDWIDNVFI